MKKFLLPFIVLILLGSVISIFTIDAVVKQAIETNGDKFTGGHVTVRSVNVIPFLGEAHISDIVVYNPKSFKSEKAFYIRKVNARFSILSLLTSGTFVIDSIQIIAPEITYEVSFMGGNLAALLKNMENRADTPDQTGMTPTPHSSQRVIIKNLLITQAKMTYGQLADRKGTGSINIPDLELHDIGESQGGITIQEASAEVLGKLIVHITELEQGTLGRQLRGLELRLKNMFQ